MFCPKCGAVMKHYDRVKRIVRECYGRKTFIFIDRCYCFECKIYRRLIPNDLIRYKHYYKWIVDGFILETLNKYMIEFEDYPCDLTISKWIAKKSAHIMK